jgi:hypothetical protein
VLGNIFRLQKQDVTGDGRRSHNGEKHDWCPSLRDLYGDKIKKHMMDMMGRTCGAYQGENY